MVVSYTKKDNIQNDVNVVIVARNEDITEEEINKLQELYSKYSNCDINLFLTECNASYCDALKGILDKKDDGMVVVEKDSSDDINDLLRWAEIKNGSVVSIKEELPEYLAKNDTKRFLEIPIDLFLKYGEEIIENDNNEGVYIDVLDISKLIQIDLNNIKLDLSKVKGIVLKTDNLLGTHCREIYTPEEMFDICRELLRYKKVADIGKNEFQKFMLAYALIGKNIEYDFDADGEASEEEDAHSVKGALLKKKAVCEGFSYALHHLLDLLGIENICVNGSEIGKKEVSHTWNQVKINGNWYNCDVTSDSGNIKDNRMMDYCLLSDEEYFLYNAVSHNLKKCDVSFWETYNKDVADDKSEK